MRTTYLATTALLVALAGCRSPTGPRHITLQVAGIAAPAQIVPSDPVALTLTVYTGGCRRFERLDATRTPEQVILVARGIDGAGPGVSCPADIREEPHTYTALPPFASSLRIVVRQPDGTELIKEVPVVAPAPAAAAR